MTPLAWPDLVAEALRRRKAEGLTQRDHAALAGVSIPTLAAFERGETTLTLAKAFDILRVVGLLEERPPEDAQDRFVREAMARWRDLMERLEPDTPARFPHGWFRFDYWLDGDLRQVRPAELRRILAASAQPHTGWPLFMVREQSGLSPIEIDGLIETWLKPDGFEGVDRTFSDAARCDFWRVAPDGRAVILRGFEEDSQIGFQPRTIFDWVIPIWRSCEALLHAHHLARQLAKDDAALPDIRLRVVYSGLTARQLKSWVNPLEDLGVHVHPARSDGCSSETAVPAAELPEAMPLVVGQLLMPLFGLFGVHSLPANRIRSGVEQFLAISSQRRRPITPTASAS
ncbi:helix-turn-helix domain-containing protein [Prosthecodimorpha staleyi]|uniref:helix-turn-helix domain-containing protein n=1 Tax=Prosthecodimorpha staleyi TaxID=2840188 RepID=UPI0021C342C6|nr:helix-turn-helix domain-containing protein [Prosthecodimorpha staleyi]